MQHRCAEIKASCMNNGGRNFEHDESIVHTAESGVWALTGVVNAHFHRQRQQAAAEH